MTTSTITRERLQEIAEDGFLKHGESKELARMALAEQASEPVMLYRERNPYNGLTTDWKELTENEFSFLKENAGENAEFLTLYRHAQPVPEHPEVLPCSVLLEPGLRFGKGIKTSTMLAALARRAVYESDMAALSPEERAEFQTRIEEFKALIAQPAPVVPDGYVMVPVEPNGDMLAAAQDAYGETDGDIASTLRAAMLAAAPQEVPDGKC
ncbi:TPA: hypothetical protein R1B10_004019 [Klebsiella pneumoniae]|nr:hypothetical protein [Klebsiella pneumoniae]HCB0080047.1 hypothetical protein [Klebsiella pneumoniae]HEB5774741.1 hypothetical protein [Klebsiella pneumoniae]HEB9057925.1 hypothetical protein [Klebsiella pneumoniae]HEB9061852.1 hypothetical protein [Klebsiella pneumoniae]